MHAFQSTVALPKASREVKRGLSLADMGTHLQSAPAEPRKIDGFPCRRARTQPEVEREGCLIGPLHVPTNDGGLACHRARGADAGTRRANRREAEPAASRGSVGNKDETNMWTGPTRSSRKRVPGGDLKPATRHTEVATSALKPPSTRRKRKREAHLPLLSRESRDAVADDGVRKVERDPEDHLNACNAVRQTSASDSQKLGVNAGFTEVRNLYDQQDKVMKVVAH